MPSSRRQPAERQLPRRAKHPRRRRPSSCSYVRTPSWALPL